MGAFLRSPAGKGTLGVCLCCVIIVWPIVGNWLVAAFTLAFAVQNLREAFRRLDADEAQPVDAPPTEPIAAALRGEPAACDVDVVMAAAAAEAIRLPIRLH